MKRTWFGLALLILMLGCFFLPRSTKSQSASPHGILLSWTPSSTSGVTYNIYRASSTSGVCGSYALISSGGAALSYSDLASGLSNSTSYCYEVDAVVGSELSGPSNVATVTTPATWAANPAPPSNCTAATQ